MAFKLFNNKIILILTTNILLLILINPCLAILKTSNTSIIDEAICNSTLYSAECLSNLPQNQSGNNTIHDYARFFILKSLSISTNFISSLDSHLKNQSLTFLPGPTIRALEDCRLLAELASDYLAKTYQTINLTNSLDPLEAEDLETFLSAVLTNQQTCSEGLKEIINKTTSSSNNVLDLMSGTKLYSISLALFKRGWCDRDYDRDRISKSAAAQRKLVERINNDGANLGGILVSQRVAVNRDGTGNFTTISDAVKAAPNNSAIGRGNSNNNSYYVIYVARGVYEEYVSIGREKQNLMLIGDGINQTVITGNRSVVDGWTTFDSATFVVTGQGFVGINITIRNTAGAIKHQAVALTNGADSSAFHRCSFEGFQDTLYAHSLRQFYRECDIYGTVDFIFGNAAVVLQNCNIYPRLPLPNQFNVITAQGRTDPNQNTGTSVHNCAVRAADDLAAAPGPTRTYLGRPWQEYSRTVFMQSFLDGLVEPSGWAEWSGDFAIDTLYYAEFNNSGPGSNTSGRVNWVGYYREISVVDAVNFTVSSFIAGDDWLLRSGGGVPFTAGLLV